MESTVREDEIDDLDEGTEIGEAILPLAVELARRIANRGHLRAQPAGQTAYHRQGPRNRRQDRHGDNTKPTVPYPRRKWPRRPIGHAASRSPASAGGTMAPAVGIDLGTTYSVVAWVTPDGIPAVIPDETGETLTPSVVSFVSLEPIAEATAKADQARGEPDVAAFFKSSMGDPAFSRRLGGRDWSATGLSSSSSRT